MEQGSTKRSTEGGVDRLSQSAHQAVDKAAAMASQYAERFSDKGEELMQMHEDWMQTARDYIRERPFQAMGMALAAGYLLSILMRSRD
jgi:ElaB/YqjD/DUF883 family membrane-anchored ribosome-binding protein